MKQVISAAALLLLACAAADSKPLVLQGGGPAAASGAPSSACGTGTVCAQYQNGQTFVTWDDVGTDGPGGANARYRMYRSTAPIDSGNYTSATLIASYIFNNSAQLYGGSLSAGTTTFNQTNRQSAAQPMSVLTDLGTPLPTYSGLQVYTALAAENAYYAIVSTDTTDGTPSFMGSVGPIGEAVATPQPIKYHSGAGQAITSPAGKPMVFQAHASGSNGGACNGVNANNGEYWEWFLTTAEGYQDGRATCLSVIQDQVGSLYYDSLTGGSLIVRNRDTVWSTNALGTTGIETFHFGMGLTPNSLVGPANRLYPTTMNAISRQLNWALTHYGADSNQLHWAGESMGAISGAFVPFRMASPKFSAVWLIYPTWRYDQTSSAWWGGTNWTSGQPFKATIGAAPSVLGTNASAVLMADGTTFGGTGGYADMYTFIAANPGDDLPVAIWGISKDDVNLTATGAHSFLEEINAVNAFQTAHRGHAMAFNMGHHDVFGQGAVDCDSIEAQPDCYGKPLFRLDQPYVAFDSSSIDDDMGTATRDSAGIADGDTVGCINCGFTWNFTTDTASNLNFTIDNNWMDRSPTVSPQTTIATSIPSSGNTNITLTDVSSFLPTLSNSNFYFVVGTGASAEIIRGVISGSVLTIQFRGQLNTTQKAHSIGDPITQYITTPRGPNGGPYSTMTVNVTPRRMQNFKKPNGTTINCTVTPDGAAPAAKSGTVVGSNGVFTLTGITINASGPTSVTCS